MAQGYRGVSEHIGVAADARSRDCRAHSTRNTRTAHHIAAALRIGPTPCHIWHNCQEYRGNLACTPESVKILSTVNAMLFLGGAQNKSQRQIPFRIVSDTAPTRAVGMLSI
jgi:hypothetical protein